MLCRYLDVNEKPAMPILVEMPDGRFGEADSIPAAMALLVGLDYIDVDDERTAWHMRVHYLRGQAMMLVMDGRKAIVRDNVSVIFDNSAAPPDDDGEDDIPEDWFRDEPPVILWASDDRVFLQSLHEADIITLYEREDSYAFRMHPAWEEIKNSKGEKQRCSICRHYDPAGKLCSPYRLENREPAQGRRCAAFAPEYLGVNPGKRKRIRYVSLREEKLVEQSWVLDRGIGEKGGKNAK